MKKILFTLFLFLLFLTETKAQNMEVVGTLKIKGGTPGVGKVLTSDATGLASWLSPVTGATLVLPYSASQNSLNNTLFRLENTNTTNSSSTIVGVTNGVGQTGGSMNAVAAIEGIANGNNLSNSTYGVRGINNSQHNGYLYENIGVYGYSFYAGVKGESEQIGVLGVGKYFGTVGYTGIGVYGKSSSGVAGQFESNSSYGLKIRGKLQFAGNGVGTLGVGKFLKSINTNGDAEWSDLFPYSFSKYSTEPLLTLTNTHTGSYDAAVFKTNTAEYYSGVEGQALNTSPIQNSRGVTGVNYSTNSTGSGVFGYHAGTGPGVWGYTEFGIGIKGTSINSGYGIFGEANSGVAGQFESNSSYGLKIRGKLQFAGNGVGTLGVNKFLKSINTNGDAEWSDLLPLVNSQNASQNILEITNTDTGDFSTIVGKTSTTGSGSGVEGIATHTGTNSNSRGVTGINLSTTSLGSGVYGFHAGSGNAVGGYSEDGIGVYGTSNDNIGIKGISTKNNGVYGETAAGNNRAGVLGKSISDYANSFGVYGVADFGIGVVGYGSRYVGISGTSDTGTGGFFGSDSGYALTTGSGKVGIGTTAPTAKMDIKGTDKFSHFYYGANEDTYIRGGKAGSKVLINDEAGMGSVGIGLLNPNEILDVNGRMRIRHKVISTVPYTSGVWMSNSTNSLSDADGAFYGMKTDFETGIFIGGNWRFWVNGAGNGYLNGNLIQTSDQRLKKNFLPITNSLSSIYKLNGYKFNWIEEARSSDLQTGLIAQEVQKIFPELVQTDEKGFLSVNYIGLVPHLIEAVKELRDENNSLKLNNQTLETKNQTLESRLDKIEAMLSTIQPNTENLNSKK